MTNSWASIQIVQPFNQGEQVVITASSYTNTGGPGIKTINIGQGDFMGNANSGGFGSFTLSGPGTFGPFTVPSGGITQLSMSVAGGQGTMTFSGTLTCLTRPSVTTVSPSTGPVAGGAGVTIHGSGFTGTTAVTFGGLPATGISVVDASTLTATTPAHAAGAVDVVVTNALGTGTALAAYTYSGPPAVTAASPVRGPVAGGTALTLTGTGFTSANAVTIGGLAATGITVVNDTTITAVSPPHAAGSVDVVVTTPFGTASGARLYTYVSGPILTAISPASGPVAGGTSVTLTGTNFTGATAVTFDGVAATGLTVVDATTITATVPAHAAGAVGVSVTTPFGTSTRAGSYTFARGPAITAITPGTGPLAGGTAVTITGTDFTGATAVTFDGAAATSITVVNATTILATTPAHAEGPADVTVTTVGGSVSGAGLFTYVAVPRVTAISPARGRVAGGTAVTITGANFTGATAVTIGGSAVTGMTLVNDTTITATTAPHAAGPAAVVVTTAGGAGTGSGIYSYVAAPTVTSVTPSTGPAEGGSKLTITGANLEDATSITIGGIAASGITVVDGSTMMVTTPAHAAGSVDVVVTGPGGTDSAAGLYTYVAELTLVSTSAASTRIGGPYSQANVASGGTPPYSYTVSAGRVPEGTSLDPSTGLVSGNPVTSGAFSYTVTVADSSPMALTASQVVTGAIAPTMTMTSLASSMNPSLIGEQVTFTATVTPATSAGSVTFTDGSTTLCTGVALASGAASCTAAFATSGPHALAAEYSGTSALAASTSAVLVQTVTDQRVRTLETIGRFMSRRNDLMAASEPDMNRQIGRLMEVDGAGAASPGNVTNVSGTNINVPDAAEVQAFRLEDSRHDAGANGFTQPYGAGRANTTPAVGSVTAGPVRMAGSTDGGVHFGFGTSLLDRQERSPVDIWVEGKYESFGDSRGPGDLDGRFGLVSIGADYVANRKLLVGAVVQIDSMRQRSQLAATEASGRGWLAGPYATVRLVDSLFLQGRAGWGGSTNDVRPYQTYTDEFDTARWLVSSTLTGQWALASLTVRPSASVAYIQDAARSYSDAFGVLIPEVVSRLGQARVGPEIGYRRRLRSGMVLEPRGGLQLISNFAGDTTADGLGRILGGNADPVGVRGRTEFGLRMLTPRGIGIDLSGSYDGIGAGDYPALGGQLTVQVPLK